jgi:hypothetical protein
MPISAVSGQPTWWLGTVVTVCAISSTFLGLRMWSDKRWLSILVMVTTAAASVAAVIASTVAGRNGALAFPGLAALYALIAGSLIIFHQLPDPPKEVLASAGLAVLLPAIVALATHAADFKWQADSDKSILYVLVGSTALACYVGKPAYRKMAHNERSGNPRAGGNLVVMTIMTGIGAILTAVPVLVLLGNSLGFEPPHQHSPTPPAFAKTYVFASGALLALAAVFVARIRQPRGFHDNRLRISYVAYALAILAIGTIAIAVVGDLFVTQPTVHPLWRAYFALLALVAGALYAEDAIVTPVRLNDLHPEWLAWVVGCGNGIMVATACYWAATTKMWTPAGELARISSTASTLGSLGLVFVTAAGAVYVLAFASDADGQQLTAKSAVSNTFQGQGLYAGLVAVSLFVPTQILARFSGSLLSNLSLTLTGIFYGVGKYLLANLPQVTAFCAFAGSLWSLYRFTADQNASHLTSESARDIPQTHLRTGSTIDSAQLKDLFSRRLERHLVWQNQAGRVLLVASLVGVGALFHRAKETIAKEAGPENP